MAKLAIKGHSKRGKEVIELLKMLGARFCNYKGTDQQCYYTIIDDRITLDCPQEKYKVFSLEAFEKKYPHKVGDKVCFPDDLSTPFTINKMWWDENANELLCSFIEDDIEVPVVGIRAYKEESIDKTNKVVFDTNVQSCDIMNDIIKEEDTGNGIIYDEIDFDRCPAADKVHLILGDNYKIKEENGNYYVVRKKPQYPKTYEECCMVLQDACMTHKGGYKGNLIQTFQKLLICRDAYWKIAGEQMGLNRPWEPDWKDDEQFKYIIICRRGCIIRDTYTAKDVILAFPTEEMRDAFYESFKGLIEQCKEFL